MIRVRDCTVDDFETLLSLGTKMREESIEAFPEIDADYSQKWLEATIPMPGVLVVLAEDDGVAVGMIVAAAGPHCFSPALRAASDLLFVLPEYRGGWAAVRLVQRYKVWVKDIKSSSAILSVATGVTPDRTARFFEVMGFRPMEKTYRMDFE